MTAVVSAAAAKSGFSELLRRAEAGEQITVTRNGEPVARIVPIRPRVGGFMRGRIVERDPDWWQPDEQIAADFGLG